MTEKAEPKGNGEHEPRVVFDYIKSQHFRVIHADGAAGSITATGHIHMAIYSERLAIPQRMAFKVTAGGRLGALIPSETIAREGMVREVEVGVMMNLQTAEALQEWLAKRIEELKSAVQRFQSSSENKQ